MLHGLGSSGADLERSAWSAFAEQQGLAWIAPNGTADSRGRRFWNAGATCCNFDHLAVDHVAALAELIERAVRTMPVDAARVYVGGHSNGAFMAHRFACERPELIRGILALSGTSSLDHSGCKVPQQLHVVQVHGDADPVVLFEGGHLFKNAANPESTSAEQTAQVWAQALGCEAAAKPQPAVDLEPSLPGAETQVSSYSGCKRGQVDLFRIVGGGHVIGLRAPAPATLWAALNR
jgi:polyhydroxybutyrate depolymerase